VSGSRRGRANGEGSIYPYRNGYAGYVWVTTPDGERKRKYVYGKTRAEVHEKQVELQNEAAKRPVPTKTPTVDEYLARWLSDVIEPNREPNTYSQYELFSRRYIIPGIGNKRIAKLTVREVQKWLNSLPGICQCCAQGKDAGRREDKRRCCAIGQCCRDYPSKRTIKAARDTLRTALTQAWREELVSRNVATMVTLPAARKLSRRGQFWEVEEARRFLESAYADHDPLYPLWVLILVLGLRKGEAQGLVWPAIDMDKAQVSLEWQVQRVGRRLIHKQQLKSDGSTDMLPLPEICLSALKLQREAQDRTRARMAERGGTWPTDELVFTTRTGRPIEPRAINRRFDARCAKAGVRRIRVHDTRRTCGSLLAALEVHPRVAMQILRHSKISITMEIYTMVPDKATRAALKRLSDALGAPDAVPPDEAG
jgi:integrase